MKDILKIIKAAKRFSKNHYSEKNMEMSFFGLKKEELKKAFKKLNPDVWQYNQHVTLGGYIILSNSTGRIKITFFT